MTEVPKIVHERLKTIPPQQTAAAQDHPEANLLTAFAEQTLSPQERELLLQHLALCADCREVVVLALPVVEEAPAVLEATAVSRRPQPARVRSPWFEWSGLRWAALAAGIAVAVLIVRPAMERHSNHNAPATAVTQPPLPVGVPASNTQIASELKTQETVVAKDRAKERSLDSKPGSSNNKPSAGLPAAPLSQAEQGTLIADNLKKESAAKDSSTAVNGASGALELGARPGASVQSSESSVEVARGDAEYSTQNRLVRSDGPAIVKAKPPLEDKLTAQPQKTLAAGGAPAALVARDEVFPKANAATTPARAKQTATWTITDGSLQRSVDGGKSWQTALQSDHSLLCFTVRDTQVWAGGSAGRLLRSNDGGTTWSSINVADQGQPLRSNITHIEVESATGITLSTSNQETWSSLDGGNTWTKK